MYWHNQQLQPGIYKEGTQVFESSYHYKDRRNSMRRNRTLTQFMQDPSVDKHTKDKIMKKIQKEHPDIVLEG